MEEGQSQDKKFSYRRMPAVYRTLDSIEPEKDIRARLLGRVVDKGQGSVFLDDGTKTAEIIMENPDSVTLNDVIRVFCRVIPLESGCELRAEIVQDMTGVDQDLYKKVKGLVTQ